MSNLLLYNDKIDPLKLITDLIDLQIALTRSDLEIQELYEKLSKKKYPIEEALAKYDESYSIFGVDIIKKKYIIEQMTTEQVVKLISKVDELSRDEREDIIRILQKSNDNVKIISQLISGLSILSNMSFDNIRIASKKMQDIDEELGGLLSSTDKNSSQLKQFVYSQYNRITTEKEKYDLLIKRIESLESAPTPKEFMDESFLLMQDKLEDCFLKSIKHEREEYNLELKKWKFLSILALCGSLISILMMGVFKFIL